MLTGDDAEAARRLAAALPFDRVVAQADPQTKTDVLREETAARPAMAIGVGIDEAPGPARPAVGVAIGARALTLAADADVVVLPDRLACVAEGFEIARRSRRIALQGIVAGLALSGFAMLVAGAGLISPVEGALVQEAIDLAVILNALRTLRQ
jgi:cation transport ATPase